MTGELEQRLANQPVKMLQYMLRRLRETDPRIPWVPLTGSFGEETLEAVMLFQRENDIPVTGVVDLNTWNAVRECWLAAESELAAPRAVRLLPAWSGRVCVGMQQMFLIVPQAMIQVLGNYLEGVQPCEGGGYHGPSSAENVKLLQKAAGQDATGILDRSAWDTLCRLYEIFVVCSQQDETEPGSSAWG